MDIEEYVLFTEGKAALGFRYFLGADVHTGWALHDLCNEYIQLQDSSFVMSEGVAGLSNGLVEAIVPGQRSQVEGHDFSNTLVILKKLGSETETPHFYPELLDALVVEVETLISSGILPSEIVVLALLYLRCFTIFDYE